MNSIRKHQIKITAVLIVVLIASCMAHQAVQIKNIARLFQSIVTIQEMETEVKEELLDNMQVMFVKKVANHHRMELATEISECMDEAFGNISDVLELICELVQAAKGDTKNDDYVFENYVEVEFYSHKTVCAKAYKKLFQEQCSVEEKTRLGGAPPGLFFIFCS